MGGGFIGGTSRTEEITPDVSHGEEAAASNQAAMEALQRQMASQQAAFQQALKDLQERTEKAQKEAEERQRTQKREQAYSDIETLFVSRLEAEETAISSVDKEIAEEQAHADLRGVDFEITEEQRLTRIQERFEEFWDVRYETELSDLMSRYGGPEMTAENRLLVERGELEYAWSPETKYTGFEYPKEKDKIGKVSIGPGSRTREESIGRATMGEKESSRLAKAPKPVTTEESVAVKRAKQLRERMLGGVISPEGPSLLAEEQREKLENIFG